MSRGSHRNKVTYRRIVPTIWRDPDVKKKLTRDQKLFLVWLFSNEHGHPCGIYHLSPSFVQDELGMTPKQTLQLLAGPLATFATYDAETEEVFVHAMAEHQIDEEGLHGKDKRIPWVEKQLRAVTSRTLVRAFHERYSEWNLDWRTILPEDEQPPTAGARKGPRDRGPKPSGNGLTTPKEKGHRKGLGKPLPKGGSGESLRKAEGLKITSQGNGSTEPKRKGHAKGLGMPAAAAATAPDNLSGSSPVPGRGRARGSPPPEQPEGVAHAERRREAARRRARGMILGVYHLGRDVVELDEYRESMDVAMARWDAAVDAGADPDELTDRMALVREVEEFKNSDPITVSVYLGHGREATRHRCELEWLKRQPVSRHLPHVELKPPVATPAGPPLPQTDPRKARQELEARIQENRAARMANV